MALFSEIWYGEERRNSGGKGRKFYEGLEDMKIEAKTGRKEVVKDWFVMIKSFERGRVKNSQCTDDSK